MRIGGFSEQTGERCPAGVQIGTLVALYDVGIQVGFEGKHQPKVVLWWESQHKDTKGRPFTLPDMVTNSSDERSRMASRYGALTGAAPTEKECEDGWDMDPLLGRACFLLVAPPKKQGGWPFISNVMPLPAGMTAPPALGVEGGTIPKFVEMMRAKAVHPGEVATPPPANVASPAVKSAEQIDSSIPF